MTTDKRQLSDEAKEEIAEAVRIVAEDKLYQRMYGNAKPKTESIPEPEPTPEPIDPNAPVSPPAKPEPDPEPPARKKAGLYWGEEA